MDRDKRIKELEAENKLLQYKVDWLEERLRNAPVPEPYRPNYPKGEPYTLEGPSGAEVWYGRKIKTTIPFGNVCSSLELRSN